MAKRKTAEQTQETIPADENLSASAETPTAGTAGAETISQPAAAATQERPALQESSPSLGSEGKADTRREPGDDAQKSWVKRASIIVDPEAGVKFHFDYEKHKAIITFDTRPSPQMLEVARPILNEGGFRWDNVNKNGWEKKIPFPQREEARREAKKTYYALANALREQKGLPARSFGEAVVF